MENLAGATLVIVGAVVLAVLIDLATRRRRARHQSQRGAADRGDDAVGLRDGDGSA
jgi:hypothetical protein